MARRLQVTEVKLTGDDEVTITHSDGSSRKMAAHVWQMRNAMLKHGLEWEISTKGKGRLTAKAPKCSTIVRQEFGITGNRVEQYKAFCKLVGFETNPKYSGVSDDVDLKNPQVSA